MKIFKVARNASATKLLVAKQPRIDRTTCAIKQKTSTAKTFNFTPQTSPLHHLPPYQALLTKFLLKALKKWSARHSSEI